ncbi:MAG TPA: DbpA RNA binding domain-containing protein, partial [Gemmatimonadaceae bacterium]|nr:DbpA RNA binding domain-containing protein [Gemmatimonadaceae bacterium]
IANNDADQPISIDYVSVSEHGRLSALRRLLDAIDPASATVFVREPDANADVSDLIRALGYRGGDVRVAKSAPPGTALAVLYDLPASREELREGAAAADRRIALVQPRQLSSLRNLAMGGVLKPIALPEAANRARERELRIRAELSATLVKGQFGRELLALEPLLDDYDGIEIAAAALQLLDRARAAKAETAASQSSAAQPEATARGSSREAARDAVRLFVNLGARDNIRASDLVGAIANTANVSSADLGKVDVRESHSTVDVAPRIADTVVERLTGTSIRGKRAVFRRDEERPPRGRPGGRDPRSDGSSGRPRGGGRPPARGARSRDRE